MLISIRNFLSFRSLKEEEDFIDVTLSCEETQYSAHKVVLSACSPYFRKLLKVNNTTSAVPPALKIILFYESWSSRQTSKVFLTYCCFFLEKSKTSNQIYRLKTLITWKHLGKSSSLNLCEFYSGIANTLNLSSLKSVSLCPTGVCMLAILVSTCPANLAPIGMTQFGSSKAKCFKLSWLAY